MNNFLPPGNEDFRAEDFPQLGKWERIVPSGQEFWSSKYYELYGADNFSRPASFESWLSMVHPEDRQRILQDHQQLQQIHSRDISNEFRILHPDGVRWIQEIGRNFYDRDGRLIRMVGIAFDITDRKFQEEKIKEAERRRNEMFAMFGHEFRQPLSVLSSAVKLWKRSPDALPMKLEEVVEEQVSRLDSLVSGLLASVRASQNTIKLTLGKVEPANHLRDVVKRAKLQFAKRNQKITLECSAFLPPVVADPLWFDQVCENLISNACKYTNPDGIISLTARTGESELVVVVKDNGSGINPEALEDIFKIFHRERNDSLGSSGGLGIGLAMVKQIVEMHGGSITAQSAGLGMGSEFTVRFPLKGPNAKVILLDGKIE